MMWTTTGNLTNVKNNAKFDFGVAMLPAGKRRGSPTGGGNFYLFKKNTPAQQAASLKFIKWITSPQRAAQWGIDTGYVAVRPDAWETPAMKKYVAGFPAAAVARDQLPYAVAELSTHENQRVTKALNDGLQAALTGAKTPDQAMKDAQAEAERILRSVPAVTGWAAAGGRAAGRAANVHVVGWLLLLPARSCCWSTVHALPGRGHARLSRSSPRPSAAGRPSSWVGLEQLPGHGGRSRVLAVAPEQRRLRAGHHPDVDRAGPADGGAGERAAPRARRSCAWPTSRRPCCR